MTADELRRKAAEFLRRARSAGDPLYKAWLIEQAQLLADQAASSAPKPPPPSNATQPSHATQQQQQPQKKEEEDEL